MKRRLYADTSVLGGYFDVEFEQYSKRFVESLREERFVLLTSGVVIEEIEEGPEKVRDLFASIPVESMEVVPLTMEIINLRDAYLKAGILGEKWIDDATHVATATVARAEAIVSWNFRHIVRLDKMKAYNRINLANGYGYLTIVTPKEIDYGESSEPE